MLRIVLGVIAGLVAGLVAGMTAIFCVELVNGQLFPTPAGLSPQDTEGMKAFVAGLPPAALAIVLAGFGLGAYVAATVALLIAHRRRPAGLVAAGIILLATFANMATLPHPMWFNIGSVIIVLLGAFLADRNFAARA